MDFTLWLRKMYCLFKVISGLKETQLARTEPRRRTGKAKVKVEKPQPPFSLRIVKKQIP